jgi:predicted TIM-barrel fold metal-dependent hydrolase
MVLDTHVHVLDRGFWPDEWFDWVALQWASREPDREPEMVRGKIEDGMIDPDGLRTVADMDAAGVDTAVILPMDWGPDFVDRVPIEQVNRHAVEMAEAHPGRFIPFAGVDPRRPEAEGLVKEALQSGSAKGLKLYPPAGFDPFHRTAWPLYELCVEHRAPVLFHTGETLAKLKVRHGDPLLLQDVHAAFPDLPTIIGHAGAKLWWEEALSVAAHSINSYLELSVWIWDDTTEDEQLDLIRKIDQARNAVGIERIVFGSDHLAGARVRGPQFLRTVVEWYRGLPEQASCVGVSVTAEEVDQIMWGNAARLLEL